MCTKWKKGVKVNCCLMLGIIYRQNALKSAVLLGFQGKEWASKSTHVEKILLTSPKMRCAQSVAPRQGRTKLFIAYLGITIVLQQHKNLLYEIKDYQIEFSRYHRACKCWPYYLLLCKAGAERPDCNRHLPREKLGNRSFRNSWWGWCPCCCSTAITWWQRGFDGTIFSLHLIVRGWLIHLNF